MYRVILVPVDGSALAERALPQALLIAHLANARVVLAQVIPRHGDDSDSASDEVEAIRGGEAYLQELAKRGQNGLDVERVVLVGEPTLTILKEAKRRDADLIVVSTHGRSGLGRWIYGSVADAVMRHAPVPVVLVPATRHASPRPEHPPRILVPLDGSSLAEEVLGPVEDLAETMQADLVLARVVEPHPAPYSDLDSLASDPTAGLAAARSYLEKVAARVKAKGRGVIIALKGRQPGYRNSQQRPYPPPGSRRPSRRPAAATRGPPGNFCGPWRPRTSAATYDFKPDSARSRILASGNT